MEPTIRGGFLLSIRLLSVTVDAPVPRKAPFSNPPKLCGTLCWPPNCRWLVTVLPQGNVELHFDFFFTAYFNGWRGGGKVVEIDDSCFSRQKCNCSRLCTTVWVFVGVEQELGHLSCACHWSLHSYIAIIKAVTAEGTTFVSTVMDSHTTRWITPSDSWHTDAHKYDRGHMDAREGYPQPALLRKQSYMCDKWIEGFSLSWVWWCSRINCKLLCLLPFSWTIYSIYLSNWIFSWYPKNN